MSTAPGDPSTQRVGDAERQSAIALLNSHWQAGRLDPGEHEARTTKAYAAVTRGDLDVLFSDLPSVPADGVAPPGQTPIGGAAAPYGAPGTPMPSTPSQAPMPPQGTGLVREGSWLDGKREAIMGVTPFVALGLFLAFGHWWFFLLIPALGALLYSGGGDSNPGKARRRRDRDERRRLERGE